MVIHSPVLIAVWFVGAGFVANWFRGRRRDAYAALQGYEGSKPSQDDADGIRMRLILDAFIGGGAILALFAFLAWLESLLSSRGAA
jgi:hypothetical protein